MGRAPLAHRPIPPGEPTLVRAIPCLIKIAVMVTATLALAGWRRPGGPPTSGSPAPAERRLAYVVVEVNGNPRTVSGGGILAVNRGDRLKVTRALLSDGQSEAEHVNVVGYVSPSGIPGEDRGFEFLTTEMTRRHSEDGLGEVFAVVASSRDAAVSPGTAEIHGMIFLRVVPPVLRFAEASINGRNVVLRDGDALSLKASDKFRLLKIATNLANDADVMFQIVPGHGGGRDQDRGQPMTDYEIRFLRGGEPFARIPLRVGD